MNWKSPLFRPFWDNLTYFGVKSDIPGFKITSTCKQIRFKLSYVYIISGCTNPWASYICILNATCLKQGLVEPIQLIFISDCATVKAASHCWRQPYFHSQKQDGVFTDATADLHLFFECCIRYVLFDVFTLIDYRTLIEYWYTYLLRRIFILFTNLSVQIIHFGRGKNYLCWIPPVT